MSNELREERLAKLEKERAILDNLMEQWADPSVHKDTRENSDYDTLTEKIKSQETIVRKLESLLNEGVVAIPGTWNIGDRLYVKYTRIVSYGKDLDLPTKRLLIKLVDSFDITTLEDKSVEELEEIPTSANTPLGKALLHKAHDSVRFITPTGYCEVEVERCLI